MEKRLQRPLRRFAARPLVGDGLRISFFLVALFFAYRYGVPLASNTRVSPLWIPGSVLLCALLWAPPRWWPLLLAATIPIRLSAIVLPAMPLWAVAAATVTDCGKCTLTAVLLRRLLVNPIRFSGVREFGEYCLVAVLLASLMGATLGAFIHTGLGLSYWQSWEHWFWGGVVANLVITPFILYWVLSPPNWRSTSARRRVEAVLLLCALLFSNWLAFTPASQEITFLATRVSLPIIFLVWTALRFGVVGASGGIALLTVFALRAALSQHSYLFAEDSPDASATDLQYFLLLHAVPLYLIAILTEVSRRNEHSLRESERRFRTLADTAPVFIWMTDSDNMCCFLNKEWLKFTGRSLSQHCGRGWVQDVHPEDIANLLAARSSIAQRKPIEEEYRMRRHDGEYRWLLSRGVPRYAPSGAFLGYIGSAIDVTDRKRSDEALLAKQDQLERITNNVPVSIIQCSRDQRFIFANKAYTELIGKPADQIVGKTLLEVLGDALVQAIKPYTDRVLAGERVRYEKEIPYATATRYLDIEYVPDVDARGAVVGWVAILSDTTERKRAEQNLRDKDQFLAMLAHELRAPLAPISAGIEVLQRATDAETLESTLPLLAHQTRHMVRLVDDLLDVSRVSLGKIDLKTERIDLHSVVDQSVHCSRSLIADKGHSLTIELEPEPIYVLADADRLIQVLCNLLNNACKYMERGGSIVLTVERKDSHALIRVRDRGIGLASEDIPRIFELFAQVDTSLDRPVGGLGIGLTLARSVIEKHGGTLEAFSDGPGRGSEFVVRLPIASRDQIRSESTLVEAGVIETRRVLIVDDNAMTAKAVARLLRTGGHVVHVAYDGPEGVEAARMFRPEVILLDIGLPKLDGYDTCRCIRNEPWGRDMMLVALSGYGRMADVQAAQAAGFDHYLLKPVTYRSLSKVLSGLPCSDDRLAALYEENAVAVAVGDR